MDFFLFQEINNLAGQWKILDYFGIFCAEYLIFLMATAVIILFLTRGDSSETKKENILKVSLSVVGSYLLKIVIQLFYFRPRPFVDHEVVKLIDKSSSSAAFPSGHTIVAFALAFSIFYYNKKLGALFIFLATLVSLGRIYTGVHYPLDVVFGIIVAWITVYAIGKMPWKKLINRFIQK
ncbi:hypothetical protein A2316_04070 [Candidatus Falkowbacteria bacterium RIFOXYB2_FULL_38_15]|uniref:Phosphatidic acid phosphatase type 2/haloperoxidase domain-containing protein n=1 Tax=Candidatus Falkowbacteria bacterium RIFOXYA2_FULL_38_12 TaxID=1797993 RepID=A0A1F5S286_9BACT|nr:MAG: hypothetical protein A2257_03215 [Candidatus Falkowbacteria bacterium RIFOXYA2_FULL_38_12]OGF33665.1 MAG: hypothetical protein A2316_04070 [Candidatus Falkowbacteria bacterium RIFOXYB2_FULL_38_15]OGF42026.1 MAG: hypothetical protein A2555_01330 [Candidatus Falkowbacteria bacterium RIFOXYD2_FULL_39_16]